MPRDIRKETASALRDLHARERMRLGWYRQVTDGGKFIQQLRERKAQHAAFLHDLLRRRDLEPAWYSRYFYYLGHLFGWFTALLPQRWVLQIEQTLEHWIFLRYEHYLKLLKLDFNIRSMIEAMQMRKLEHNEPGADVLLTLEQFRQEQRTLARAKRLPS